MNSLASGGTCSGLHKCFKPVRSSRGSALPLVLLFAATAGISVFLYMGAQYRAGLAGLAKPALTQLELNARSGIWYGLDYMRDSATSDSLATIDPLDTLFSLNLFDPGGSTSSPLYEFPARINLFSDSGFGSCELEMEPDFFFLRLVSRSFRGERGVEAAALLGGTFVPEGDTVLYTTDQGCAAATAGRIDGECAVCDSLNDLSLDKVGEMVEQIVQQMGADTTDAVIGLEMVVQNREQLLGVEPIVHGPLLLDGSYTELVWNKPGQRIVYGDLQISGSVTVRGGSFWVTGDIKIFDDVKLENTRLFTTGSIFIGDRASGSVQALALRRITVYGNARVKGESVLMVYGRTGNQSPPSSASTGSGTDAFSLFVSESAEVDGVVIAAGTPGGVKIDPEALVNGIVFAQSRICLLGTVQGVVKCPLPVDCSSNDSSGLSTAALSGTIEPLSTTIMPKVPFFWGKMRVVTWEPVRQIVAQATGGEQ